MSIVTTTGIHTNLTDHYLDYIRRPLYEFTLYTAGKTTKFSACDFVALHYAYIHHMLFHIIKYGHMWSSYLHLPLYTATCTHAHMHTCTLAHMHTCTHAHILICVYYAHLQTLSKREHYILSDGQSSTEWHVFRLHAHKLLKWYHHCMYMT